MLIPVRSRFLAVFAVGLVIIIVHKLIEFKQSKDAEQTTDQSTNSSDNKLIFVHSVSFRIQTLIHKVDFGKILGCVCLNRFAVMEIEISYNPIQMIRTKIAKNIGLKASDN